MTIPPASGRWEPYTPPVTGPIAEMQAAAAAAGGPAYVLPAYAPGPLADQLVAELLAVQEAVAPLRERIQQTNRQALATFMSYVVAMTDTLPEPARAPLRRQLTRLLAGVDTDVKEQIWEALTRALFYGHQTALSYIPDSQMFLPDPAQLQWLEQVAAATQARLDAAVASARAFVQTNLNGDFDQVLSALTPMQDAVNKLDRDVRWATNAAYNQAVRAAADAHGLSRMWVAERDACLHCLGLSGHVAGPGQPYDASLTFYIGPEGFLKPLAVYPPGPLWGPPRHPNCVPAGTIVSGPGVQLGYRRWYTGELVEVRTESGHVLAVTPNHPILTPQGWVPAGELVPGSDVVRDLGGPSGVGRPDEDQQPAPIEQVFSALRVALGVSPVRVALAPEDLHGDGADGEVEIVPSLRFLQDRAEVGHPLRQVALVGAHRGPAGLAGPGPLFEQMLRSRPAGDATTASHRPGHVLLRGFVGGNDLVGLDPAANGYVMALEGEQQGASAPTVLGGELLEARPGQVAFDAVVEIRRFPWSGHVYNFQTAGGWYTANGIVTHNCRCHQVPLPDISGYPVMPWESGPTTPGDALQREARRSVLRGVSGSDSLPARIRATDDLLRRGAGLPVSVERRARTAVRRRRYGA